MPFNDEFLAQWIQQMRQEMSQMGFEELVTPEEVDRVLGEGKGTALVAVNSMCGCAGGVARPAARMALEYKVRPDRLVTVFAGQDREATARAREYFTGYPPSSPSFFLLKDGEVVHTIERARIESREPQEVAAELMEAFDRHCN